MYEGVKITVTVPAFNEERLIDRTLDSIPDIVDHVIVVDDASTDDTFGRLEARREGRVSVVRHEKNGGVGAAIVTGYRAFLDGEDDVCVVMAGDAQMDPDDLVNLVQPIADGEVDYVKGNRLFQKDVLNVMPRDRFVGNVVFTFLTKWASGYWHVVDSQCGYTAVTRDILKNVELEHVYPRYGFPNDFLIRLNVVAARVADVPVRVIYGEEVSGIRPAFTIPRIGWLLVRGFWYRMWHRYVLRDFHPLVLLYAFGFIISTIGLASGVGILTLRWVYSSVPTPATSILAALFMIVGFQSLLFAMMFDMMHNASLRGRS